MINSVVLVARLVKTPELKMTQSNIPFTNFTVAVNRQFKSESGEQEADFINCITWRAQAENLCKYQTKGSLIGISGRITTRNYEKDDRTIYVTEVVADSIQFLESKGDKPNYPTTDEQIDETYKYGNPTNKPTHTTAKAELEEDNKKPVDSESLPF